MVLAKSIELIEKLSNFELLDVVREMDFWNPIGLIAMHPIPIKTGNENSANIELSLFLNKIIICHLITFASTPVYVVSAPNLYA
jgi:hypothetical protein